MAPVNFARRIKFHRRRANLLVRRSARRHVRAHRVLAKALAVAGKGFHRRAARLGRRALRLKAMAVRAGGRAKLHLARIAGLRQRRVKFAGR